MLLAITVGLVLCSVGLLSALLWGRKHALRARALEQAVSDART